VSFLFRKYLKNAPDDEMSQAEASEVSSEEPRDVPPLEITLWPPSPKVQIILIAVAIGLFNLILLGIWAYVLYRVA